MRQTNYVKLVNRILERAFAVPGAVGVLVQVEKRGRGVHPRCVFRVVKEKKKSWGRAPSTIVALLPFVRHSTIIARVKLMSNLEMASKRLQWTNSAGFGERRLAVTTHWDSLGFQMAYIEPVPVASTPDPTGL